MGRPALLRGGALLTGAAGVAGMIVSSIAGSTDGALAFGLVCAAAALVLFTLGVLNPPAAEVDPLRGAEIERLVDAVVAQGADEHDVRHLLRLARNGRSSTAPSAGAGTAPSAGTSTAPGPETAVTAPGPLPHPQDARGKDGNSPTSSR